MPLLCPQCRVPVQIVGQFTVCPQHGPVAPIEVAGPRHMDPAHVDAIVIDQP